MIPANYIQEWSNIAPRQDSYQVEQDLVISKTLIQIFADPFLRDRLAFRVEDKIFFTIRKSYKNPL
jgi:hypothetical protein